MLDNLLKRIKEEIAIDGPSGSNINTVWEYVKNISSEIATQSEASIDPLIDDNYKSLVWNYLKVETDLEFFTNDDPSTDNTNLIEADPADQAVVAENLQSIEHEETNPEVDKTQTTLTEDKPVEDAKENNNSSSVSETVTATRNKRKNPPVKAKSTPKKKAKAKPGSKPKRKLKPKKKINADSENDSDSSFEESSSESSADFSDESDEDDGFDVEDESDDESAKPKEKKTNKAEPKIVQRYSIADQKAEEPANFTLVDDISELSYLQVKEKYGSRLHIRGSPQLQEEQLYIGVPHGVSFSANLIAILKIIIRSRSEGVYQASFTKILNIDSRSTGHYCKSLEEKGAITRRGVSINGMATNVCVHSRFRVQKSNLVLNKKESKSVIPYNVNAEGRVFSQKDVLDSLVVFAKNAANQTVVAWDVLHALGFDSTKRPVRKWFNRSVADICLKGYFKKYNAYVDDTGLPKRCLKMIKSPEENLSSNWKLSLFTEEKTEVPIRIKSTRLNVPIVHTVIDVSIERQCFQIIEAAGTKGITQAILGLALQTSEHRILGRVLERMVEKKPEGFERFGIVRFLEFEGRLRRYRYYTYAAYQKATQGIDIEVPPLPETEIDELTLTERDIFIDPPHTKKEVVSSVIKSIRNGDTGSGRLSAIGVSRKKAIKKATGKKSVNTLRKTNVKRTRLTSSNEESGPSKKPKTGNQLLSEDFESLNNEEQPTSSISPISKEIVTTTTTDKALALVTESSTVMDVDETPEVQVITINEQSPTKETEAVTTANAMETPIAKPSSPTIATNVQTQSTRITRSTTRKKTITDYFSKASKPTSTPAIATAKSAPVTVSEANHDLPSTFVAMPETNNTENSAPTETNVIELAESLINESSSANVDKDFTSEPATATSSAENKSMNTETVIPETSVSAQATSTDEIVAVNLTTSKRSSKRRYQPNTPLQVNKYLQSRVEVLTAVFQDHPIIELGKVLKDAYLEKCKELKIPMNSNVCNKTLTRTVTELCKNGVAKLETITIPLLSGRKLQRKLAVRSDIDLEGKFYLDYIRKMKEQKSLAKNYRPLTKVEMVNGTVERLDERIERIKDEKDASQGESSKDDGIKVELEKYAENLKKFGRSYRLGNSSSWLIRAIQLGWVSSRMIRCKILHQHLFDLISSDKDLVEVDKIEGKISLRAMMNNMPVSVMCQVIGLTDPSKEVIEYVQDPRNSSVVLSQIPKRIARLIFTERNKYRRRLIHVLTTLEYIGIVSSYDIKTNTVLEVAKDSKFTGIAVDYRLNNHLVIRDRKRIGYPVLREHTIVSKSDLHRFWTELRFACTNVEIKDIPKEELAPEPTNPHELIILRSLYHTGNWSVRSVFDRSQRKVLNSYVNKIERTTPMDKPAIIRDIAESLNVKAMDVRSYYEKIEDAMYSKHEDKERKKLERRLIPYAHRRTRKRQSQVSRRVLTLTSSRAFQSIGRIKKQRFNLPAVNPEVEAMADMDKKDFNAKREKGHMLFLDDMDKVPVLQGDVDTSLRAPRGKRAVWTAQDNELLILSQIILRKRSFQRRFRWAAMKQIFPDKSYSSCRNHFDKLMYNPENAELFQIQTMLWDKIYDEGIQSGELEDKDPEENVNFDLLGFVAYFIKKLVENKERNDKTIIPQSSKELEEHFDVINLNKYCLYFEDSFHCKTSMTSRQMVLYNTPYTIRKYNMDKYDQPEWLLAMENDKFQKQCAMYQSYALMCLMTPIEVFDPFFSYSILKKFPQGVHDEAIRKMHKKGILVKRRGERALPGTLMSLAAKFFNVMVGQLPDNIFKQAVEYDKFLSSKDSKVHFSSEFVSSGMMACVLNLLSENKLSITFTYPEREILRMESLPMKLRSIDQSLISMEIDIEKVKKDDDEFIPYIPPINKLNLKRLNAEEYKDVLSNFLLSQDEFFSVLAVKIVDLLYKEKEYGLSLYQIKTRLEDFYTDEDITLLLERLCLNNPALISRVGFNIERYVHIDFIDQWAIINKNIPVYPISEKTKERMTGTSAIVDTPMKRKEVVVPCLWTDVNGHSSDLIFKGCKEVIVDLVLRKPGIMEADIYRHLSLGLTRNEVLRLLTDLVEQGVLKQTQIVISFDHQSKPSIFKKRLPFRCTNNIVIEKTALTCFWVTPSYYTL